MYATCVTFARGGTTWRSTDIPPSFLSAELEEPWPPFPCRTQHSSATNMSCSRPRRASLDDVGRSTQMGSLDIAASSSASTSGTGPFRRKSTPANAVELHGPRSRMHRAIQCADRDGYKPVQLLLDAGHQFCTGDGLNCFVLAAQHKLDNYACLEAMLLVNPRGANAKTNDGDTMLMLCWHNVKIVKKLVALGANVNAVNNAGFSVLTKAVYHTIFNIKAVELLLDKGAVIRKGFLDNLAFYIQSPEEGQKRAAGIFIFLVLNNKLTSKMVSSMNLHPLFLLSMIIKISNRHLMGCRDVIKIMCGADFRPKDNSLCIRVKNPVIGDDTSLWHILRHSLQIPSVLTFDILGFYLYNINLLEANSKEVEVALDILDILLETELGPSHGAEDGVVHPIHALLFNIVQKFEVFTKNTYQKWNNKISEFLLICLQKMKSVFVQSWGNITEDREVLYLETLVLMVPLLASDNEPLVDCIMALFQLSPLHPYQQINMLLDISSKFTPTLEYFRGNYLLPALVERIAESCDSLTHLGLDAVACKSVENFINRITKIPKFKKMLHIEGAKSIILKSKDSISSLKWMCVLAIRKTLFDRSDDVITPLPNLIRKVCFAREFQCELERDLLIFKPNTRLNF